MEQVARPSWALARWRDSGAFATVVPTLADAPDALLRAVDALPLPGPSTRPLRKPLRFAALFSGHDGKAAEQALRALRFSNQDINTVSVLVDRFERFGTSLGEQLSVGVLPSNAELRRVAAAVGRLRVAAFVRLCAARWATGDRPVEARMIRALYRRLLHIAFNDAIEVADLAVDGDDLRRAGIPTGPRLGQTLQRLLDVVIEDPTRNTRDALLRIATQGT